MAYYGPCDQRKPGCLKCEKSHAQCPGYRNLHHVLFRDESERIVRKVRQTEQSQLPAVAPDGSVHSGSGIDSPLLSISRPLPQPINDLGASFFFTKYTFNQPPFGEEYHSWLTESYSKNESILRAAIEAVGMAGISNVSYAPNVASRSKELYCKAIRVMNQALSDPAQVTADATLMAVILLGLFETVNFDTWGRYGHWAAHIKGAAALLGLRGKEQFTRCRGGLLYILTRSQILAACAQQHLPVPPVLVKTTHNFQASTIRQQWQLESLASDGSICEISFRLVNLRAVCKACVTDPEAIRKVALDIDAELESWQAGMSQKWRYTTVDVSKPSGNLFEGKRHVYPNLWIAEIWNNWRIMRVLANQIIRQMECYSGVSSYEPESNALAAIQRLSADVCISISSFRDTPRQSTNLLCTVTQLTIHRYPLPHQTALRRVAGRIQPPTPALLCRAAIAAH
ncbi:hypothetical protein AK830_g7849 [Neonectria ditissima]|uniref:Zn(2)-C6 fungal-type domain-containing protein n=1 Tax=Neonectria ditissima TaxID=78410 RepID=A0A0P7AYT3_9HYPO|nr:hypothetical protein AK830_g7849 [Neonectria ditissima]